MTTPKPRCRTCGGELIIVGPIAAWGGKFRVWCVGTCGAYRVTKTAPP